MWLGYLVVDHALNHGVLQKLGKLLVVVPWLLTFTALVDLYELFIPIMRRSGANTPSNVLIGVMASIPVAALRVVLPELKFSACGPKALSLMRWISGLTYAYVLLGLPGSFQFDSHRHRQFSAIHVDRKFVVDGRKKHEDTGVWVASWDMLGARPFAGFNFGCGTACNIVAPDDVVPPSTAKVLRDAV